MYIYINIYMYIYINIYIYAIYVYAIYIYRERGLVEETAPESHRPARVLVSKPDADAGPLSLA